MANLRVKATLDRSEYDRGLESIKNSSNALNDSLKSLGSVGGMIAGVFGGNLLSGIIERAWQGISGAMEESSAKMAKLGHESETLQIMASELREVQSLFAKFGVEGDGVTAMFGRLANARDKALGGDSKMLKDFEQLGFTLDELQNKDAKQIFDKLAAAYAEGGDRNAAISLIGKSIKDPNVQRALSQYGSGERADQAFSAAGNINLNSLVADISEKKGVRRKAGRENFFGQFASDFKIGLGTLTGGLMGVSVNEIEKEKQDKAESAQREAAARESARKSAAERAKSTEEATKAEEARYAKDVEAERRKEIENGMRLDRPGADNFARRGLMVGGSAVNTQAYAEGRKQVQLAQQLLESSRKIEAHLAIAARHKEATDAIKRNSATASTPEVGE
ncbi:MAG: hypothetical protein WC736_15315 [Gallionella sp.]|jgi:hypothetical protein